jgi:hypothetical protein
LPKAVQECAEAYSSCVSGAEIKDKYLDLIRKAGFEEVKVLQEKAYPLEFIVSEPEAKEAVNSLGLTQEEVREVAKTILSVSVSASKP